MPLDGAKVKLQSDGNAQRLWLVLNPVYTIQLVVKPVVQPVVRLYNRFDNRLYRVNKHPTG